MLGQNTDLEHEITIKADGQLIDIEQVDLVEFSFGSLVKYYPTDENVRYDNGSFFVRLTQEETQNFENSVTVQVRVKFSNRDIPLSNKKVMPVNSSLSKAVL